MSYTPQYYNPQDLGPTPAGWQSVPSTSVAGGYGYGQPHQRPQHPAGQGPSGFNEVLVDASTGFLRTGIGAYGEKLFGSGKNYVQSNMNKYFSSTDLQYYFQVNDLYVWNKLKIILCPFLYKGHWTRIAEQVAGGLTYKLPRHDINAPDLYIPFMAFSTYVVAGAFALGLQNKFAPIVMNSRFTKALVGWILETILLRSVLYTLGSGDTPILDLVAYGGYSFVGVTVSIISWVIFRHSYYLMVIWTSLCMSVFLVKTMKRVLFAETRQYERDSSRHRYILLLMGALQLPIFLWLGKL